MKAAWLLDRRRWRAAWTALTFDSLLLMAICEGDARPSSDVIVAVAPDDAAWAGMAKLAEEYLPDAIREGWFAGMDKWIGGEIPATPEPDLGLTERLNPRRFAAMRDIATGSSFLSIAVWPDGAHAATALMATDDDHADALHACELLADAFQHGRFDHAGTRFEWWPTDDSDGDAA